MESDGRATPTPEATYLDFKTDCGEITGEKILNEAICMIGLSSFHGAKRHPLTPLPPALLWESAGQLA